MQRASEIRCCGSSHLTDMKGFTLIEIVIYLALLSLLMLGCVSLAYGTSESADGDAESLVITEEGAFVIAKLTYAAGQGSEATVPASGTSAELRISTADESVDPIIVRLRSGTIEMREGDGAFFALTSLPVETLSFAREDEALIARFVIKEREFATVLFLP